MHPAAADAPSPVPLRERGDGASLSEAERAVVEALRGIAYGQVEVVVHASRIVQITRCEKLRPQGDAD